MSVVSKPGPKRRLQWTRGERAESYGMGRKRRKVLGDIVTWIVLLLGGIIFVLPFVWMLSSSLKPLSELYQFPPTFIPRNIQWGNYIEIWRRLPFGRFYLNSTFVAVSVTMGSVFTSSMAGYSFARLPFPGRDKIFLIYVSTMMVPFAVTMIPMYVLMRTFGWVNELTSLIVPSLCGAWGTFLMRQFMLTIPPELEDAALIDGSSYFGIYWRIILPLSKPVVATLAMFSFMGQWNDFLWPLIMISSLKKKTLSLGLAALQERVATRTPWHLLMAAAVLSIIPVVIVFIVGQKYYVRGIVTSGIKG